MSSKAITTAYTHFLQFRIQYSSIALLYYDYALTFPREVKYIWGHKFRISTLLYVFCRYALVANILYLLAVAGKLHASCNTWYKFIGAVSVLGRAAVIIVFTLRAWAVFSRSRLVLAYLGLLGAVCIALDITHVPGLRCVGSASIPIANDLLSILMVVFESSSAILTTVRSAQAIRGNGAPWYEQKKSFFYLVLEQGVLYFCIVSLITLAAVILNFRATGFFQRLLNALLLPLSGLLTARFLLHLREWERRSEFVADGTKSNAGAERNQELSEFEVARRTVNSLVDDFGADPVIREQNRDIEALDIPMATQRNFPGDSEEDMAVKVMSVKEGKRRMVV